MPVAQIREPVERSLPPDYRLNIRGRVHPGYWKPNGLFDSLFDVSSEKQAYKVARTLLKDFALECIEEEATHQNLSPSIRKKVQAKALLEISKQTENFSIHWAQFSARGLAKVTDLEAYVKRRLVCSGRL